LSKELRERTPTPPVLLLLILVLTLAIACGDSGTNARRDVELSAVTADAGGPYAALLDNPTITFVAGGSVDPENEIEQYEWNFGDDNSGEGKVVTHEYPDDGVSEYTVELTVRNELGTVLDTDSTRARIRERPIAAFEVEDEGELKVGTPLIFDASGSHDGDELGYVAEYRWDFSYDGVQFNPSTAVPEAVVSHTYLTDGGYEVALVVLDDDGFESAPAQKTIVVAEAEGAIIIIE